MLSTIILLCSAIITIPSISIIVVIFILSMIKTKTIKLGGISDEDNIWD